MAQNQKTKVAKATVKENSENLMLCCSSSDCNVTSKVTKFEDSGSESDNAFLRIDINTKSVNSQKLNKCASQNNFFEVGASVLGSGNEGDR